MLKYFPFYLEVQRTGQWKKRFEASAHYAEISGDKRPLYPPVMLEELTGKNVLMVGYGAIGQQIERMLEPFHVELVRVARSPRTEPEVHAVSELDSLLPRAQVVILILPATPDSIKLIGARQLALMPQGALLVNAARGPIVETDALVEALNSGRIRAALDVTDPEPLPDGHPLWTCPNLLITPHVADRRRSLRRGLCSWRRRNWAAILRDDRCIIWFRRRFKRSLQRVPVAQAEDREQRPGRRRVRL